MTTTDAVSPAPAHPLAGVTCPIVTVMSAPGVPDAEAALPLVEVLAAAGVDNLMLLGSNGEGALLEPAVAQDYLVEVTRAWRRLRPGGHVLVNVSAAGTDSLLSRAESAMAAAPDLLIASPPSYFRHRDDEIVSHLRALERFGVPFAVYNVPKYAGPFSERAFRMLLDESPALVGVKDSSGSVAEFSRLLEQSAGRPGIGVTQGDELRLAEGLFAGAIGITPGTANIAPGLAVALQRAVFAGDRAEAARLQEVTTALTGLHAIRPGVPSVKAILAGRGLIPEPAAKPLAAVTDQERRALERFCADFEEHLVDRR